MTDRAHTLGLPDGCLYYEVRGRGPVLMFIPPGNGDAGPFEQVAGELADRYTVVTYDRRGYSRSVRDGPIDASGRMDIDVSDANLLLSRLDARPAVVVGSCSGATVGLYLLARYPERIRTLVAHEPPSACLLADSRSWVAFYAGVYDVFRAEGAEAAMRVLKERMGMTRPVRPPAGRELPPERLAAMLARIRRNHAHWLEYEMRTYAMLAPATATLEPVADRLVLAGGTDSRRHHPYQPNVVLARRLGLSIVDFPGGHVGYVTHPVEFARLLADVLSGSATCGRPPARG